MEGDGVIGVELVVGVNVTDFDDFSSRRVERLIDGGGGGGIWRSGSCCS